MREPNADRISGQKSWAGSAMPPVAQSRNHRAGPRQCPLEVALLAICEDGVGGIGRHRFLSAIELGHAGWRRIGAELRIQKAADPRSIRRASRSCACLRTRDRRPRGHSDQDRFRERLLDGQPLQVSARRRLWKILFLVCSRQQSRSQIDHPHVVDEGIDPIAANFFLRLPDRHFSGANFLKQHFG